MKFRILLLLILTISVITGLSQKFSNFPTWNVDSLLLILPGQQAEERVNSLNKLAVSLSFIDFDSSMQFADEALTLSIEIGYEEGMAGAYRNYGHIYQYQGDYPYALKNYLEAFSLFENQGIKHTAAWVCYDIARTHYFARNYEKTIEYGCLALDIFREQTENGTTIGSVRDTIAMIGGLFETYSLIGEDNKALELGRILNKVVNQDDHFPTIERVMNAWAFGAVFLYLNQLDSARVFCHKALAYPEENKNVQALKYRAVLFLGSIHRYSGEIDSAIYYYQQALDWYSKNGILLWELETATRLGILHHKLNDFNNADRYLRKSEKIFDEMIAKDSWYSDDSVKHLITYGLEYYFPLPPVKKKEMTWDWGTGLYYWLFKNNEAKQKTEQALKYHIAYTNALDTLNKIQRNRDLVELQTKYETEKHENDIEKLTQENAVQELKLEQSRYLLLGLVGLVILILSVALFIIKLNKLRDQQQSLVLQQKLFRSQMNPHFIFNSLTSIQNYIMDAEVHKASKFLSRFSKLIRHILDSSVEEFVTLEEEISTIENYLELQKIRFKDKFDYTIESDKAINPENVNIPPMLAQPYIENSIEHGIKHKKSKGNIFIRFLLKNNYLVFEVEDDGVGREKAQEILYKQNKNHKSHATSITHDRIKVLNKKLKIKITLRILDLKNDKDVPTGTKVVLTIPFI